MDANQGGPFEEVTLPAAAPPFGAGASDGEARRRAADEIGGHVHRGLLYWAALAFGGTALSIGLKRNEAPLFLVLAALFALVQSWDVRDRARAGELAGEPALEPGSAGLVLRALVPLVTPVLAAVCYVGLGTYARTLPVTAGHVAAERWCWSAAAACLAMTVPVLARLISAALLPNTPYSQTARLTASIGLALLLLPVPVRLLIDDLMSAFTGTGTAIVDIGGLIGQLAGEVVLALAAVGLWVARDARGVRERLGLGRIDPGHLFVAVVGFGAVMLLNSGMEALEHARFPSLWAADQDMGKLIAGNLGLVTSIVLGVSAGVGEELLVRGALQPRAGLFWASVLFMCGHVQYTWFGMLTILMLGVSLGIVRNRANTTTAIVVHAAYDIIAALGTK